MTPPPVSGPLELRFGERLAARIEIGGDDGIAISYAPEWADAPAAFPLSLSLAKAVWRHQGSEAARFLASLTPFGALRAAALATLGRSPGDPLGDMALLGAYGGDLPGAFRVLPQDEARRGGDPLAEPGYRPIDSLAALAERARAAPLLLGEPGAAHLLHEGSQNLPPVARIEGAGRLAGGLALPLFGAPSSHDLWEEPAEERGLLENRLFHQRLAEAVRIPAAQPELLTEGRLRVLLIPRGDRERRCAGWARRSRDPLLLAAGSARSHDGPAAVLAWADRSLDAKTRLQLLDLALFSLLIGAPNAPFCGAALRIERGAALAPITAFAGPSPGADVSAPLRLGERRRPPERAEAEDWRAFARAATLNSTFTLDRIAALADRIQAAAPKVATALRPEPALDAPALDYFARRAARRAQEIAARVASGRR